MNLVAKIIDYFESPALEPQRMGQMDVVVAYTVEEATPPGATLTPQEQVRRALVIRRHELRIPKDKFSVAAAEAAVKADLTSRSQLLGREIKP